MENNDGIITPVPLPTHWSATPSQLWLLRPLPNQPAWKPWYDKAFGFVVRAYTEDEARDLASKEAGAEKGECSDRPNPWLDSSQSSCTELTREGKSEVIMGDFANA